MRWRYAILPRELKRARSEILFTAGAPACGSNSSPVVSIASVITASLRASATAVRRRLVEHIFRTTKDWMERSHF